MLGPLIERIDRRLMLLEASERLERITVDEMTDALLDVRLGCEGSGAEDQRQSTRYYAERLLRRLADGARGEIGVEAEPKYPGKPTNSAI